MAINVKLTRYEPLPEGIYNTVLAEVVEDLSSEYGERLRFRFEVIDGEKAGKSVSKWVNNRYSSKSTLYALVRALLRTDSPPAELNLEELVGRRVTIAVKVANGANGPSNRIDTVLAAKA